jgi:hypothetical protein
MGWSGVTNGKLLALAAPEFDCLLTVDANIENQQHLPSLPIAILLVRTRSNDPKSFQALVPEIQQALAELKLLQFQAIGA